VSGSAIQKLDQLAKARQVAVPTQSYAQAYDSIIQTPEGARLYEETINNSARH
jgi:hypothetical protein